MEKIVRMPQRTGWVILVLMAATNSLPWMEPLIGETLSADLVEPASLRTSIGACILGAALVAITWLAGRHATSPLPLSIARPRLLGFRLALASAGVNILMGCALASNGSAAPLGPMRLGLFVGIVWFVTVLPVEVAAAYLTGRGSARRPAPVAATPDSETGPRELASQAS
jgi:hypothetical protein